MPVVPHYEPRLVALSVIVASLASFVALDLAGRTQAAAGRARLGWLICGSVVMGVGIWSMHFVGMLAFGLNAGIMAVQIAYDRVGLIASVLVAIAASALALEVASRRFLGTRPLLGAGCLMGGAIAGMHYLGMAAMRMAASLHYSAPLVTLSVFIAVAASIVALALARRLGETKTVGEKWAKRVAAGIMGIAIAGMHYTGMAAAHFGVGEHEMSSMGHSVLATSGLAIAVTLSALIVFAGAATATALDRRHGRLGRTARAAEARYRALTQSVSDAVFCIDSDGCIVFWNGAAEQIFGYPASVVNGQSLALLIGERSAEFDVSVAASGPGILHAIELEGRKADGTLFPLELTLTESMDDDESIITGIIRDITERKRAEAALRESEQRYRKLVEHSPEAIVLHADDTLLYANPAAAALIGVADPSLLRGQSVRAFIPVATRDLVVGHAVSEPGAIRQTVEYEITHSDGRALYVEATSVSATFDQIAAVQTHLRDVTAQKALEGQLQHQAFHD
ncbi:MAG TPA: MHYT domain-containing protein, partial [Gemmatimonadaceae bacterium]|nr:MHYT domain-containing protein [Gemmatimonadaceae bacterium]